MRNSFYEAVEYLDNTGELTQAVEAVGEWFCELAIYRENVEFPVSAAQLIDWGAMLGNSRIERVLDGYFKGKEMLTLDDMAKFVAAHVQEKFNDWGFEIHEEWLNAPNHHEASHLRKQLENHEEFRLLME